MPWQNLTHGENQHSLTVKVTLEKKGTELWSASLSSCPCKCASYPNNLTELANHISLAPHFTIPEQGFLSPPDCCCVWFPPSPELWQPDPSLLTQQVQKLLFQPGQSQTKTMMSVIVLEPNTTCFDLWCCCPHELTVTTRAVKALKQGKLL